MVSQGLEDGGPFPLQSEANVPSYLEQGPADILSNGGH